jgi:hypothetical protein
LREGIVGAKPGERREETFDIAGWHLESRAGTSKFRR